MDHEEAVKAQLVERYVLGDLSAAERQDFEEHYFDCAHCAAELKTALIFAANARAVFEREPVATPRRRAWAGWAAWFRGSRPAWALAAAGVLLAMLAIRGAVRIPQLEKELARLEAPQAYPAFFLRPATRGDEQVLDVRHAARFVGLSIDVPPGQTLSSYTCELLDERGGRPWSVTAPAPAAPGQPLNVLVPGTTLAPGRYTLILRGGDAPAGTELSRYGFTVQSQP